MLKQDNRISRNKDFDRVFKTGQSFYAKVLGAKAVKNDSMITRFGILVSTKVSKKAVIRNKIKRQIREISKAELNNLKKGYDVVLIVFPQILDKNFQELTEILKSSFKRLNLYK